MFENFNKKSERPSDPVRKRGGRLFALSFFIFLEMFAFWGVNKNADAQPANIEEAESLYLQQALDIDEEEKQRLFELDELAKRSLSEELLSSENTEVVEPKAAMPQKAEKQPKKAAPKIEKEDKAEEVFPENIIEIEKTEKEQILELKDAVDKQVSANLQVPAESWEQKVSYINEIELPPEVVYGFYEEKLPDDVIIPDAHEVKHPKISSMKIELSRKPPYFGKKPLIAIVIDDMGVSRKRTADIASLKYPLTSSFLTYVSDLDAQVASARKSGHEIMAHLPMQPQVSQNVSPDVLTVKMSKNQVSAGLKKMLAKFRNIKGVNNHMGSKFTEDEERMNVVMQELAKKNLFFLDSKTTAKSVGEKTADKNKVKYISRNVFLDNKDKFDYIMRQLHQVEKIARQNGYAVAIGHPKAQTHNALKVWLPTLKSRNIRLVHLSEIVDILNGENVK